ncbi:major facilitator superfamily domain-containing protein [Irpex lacteus]|nr:major facilitator superfamily domain-containing protein [Irpex lacteus]
MSTKPRKDSLTTVHVNPFNNKCRTLPILAISSPYSRNFHLSWLGFWVAFLSWFAFSPLVPEAVRTDLGLTQKQIGNSNIVSLCATLIARVIVGPLVDLFGPRKVMAGILLVGAIPSGLAGTVSSAQGLYIIRFFIGILGATFVPCQAWTTAFFDTNVVGRANALVGGWGNSGGGFTFLIMVGLYNRLREDRLSAHNAWRASFAIVPVPILIITAIITLVFGTDRPGPSVGNRERTSFVRSYSKHAMEEGEVVSSSVHDPEASDKNASRISQIVGNETSEKGVGVGSHAATDDTTKTVLSSVLLDPLTWLPSLAYLTSFGYELAIDANLSNVLFGLYSPTKHSFNQTVSGYVASIYGLLNLFSRPLGGYLGDLIYRKYGVRGKKYLVLLTGVIQGLFSIGLGVYIDHHHDSASNTPSLAVVITLMTLLALVNEIVNGANFSLVPHCNSRSNGSMTGIVGAMGNLGGVFFALVWRYQPQPFGRAFWISGAITIAVNLALVVIRVPYRN